MFLTNYCVINPNENATFHSQRSLNCSKTNYDEKNFPYLPFHDAGFNRNHGGSHELWFCGYLLHIGDRILRLRAAAKKSKLIT